MNSNSLTSLLLFAAVVVLSVILGGREINSKIEETIKENYETEIAYLKNKLNEHSELINSIIDLGESETASGSDSANKDSADTSSEKENFSSEFEYIKENGGITITRYVGSAMDVEIPSSIEDIPVLRIGENAFSDTAVKSVTLPVSCEAIDWFAFYGCYALKSVRIPLSVEQIGYGAFDSCSRSLTIYCYEDSYAESFAESFGISYTFIK